MQIIMEPIGTIRSQFRNSRDVSSADTACARATIEIDERFAEGIADIKAGDRMTVVFYFDRSKEALLTVPRRGVGPMVGVFSTHSPTRPNFIGISDVTIESLTGLTLSIVGCDMFDRIPVLDHKPAATA